MDTSEIFSRMIKFIKGQKTDWLLLGDSVQGSSHILKEQPNQDAMLLKTGDRSGYPFLVAIADGHGDERSFRSKRGANFAVNVAGDVFYKYFQSIKSQQLSISAMKDIAHDKLTKEIIIEWQKRVRYDWENTEFTKEEVKHLISTGLDPLLLEHQIYSIYGATLIVASVDMVKIGSSELPLIIYLQIGDGDLLVVSSKGEVNVPIPRVHAIGEATDSLGSEKPWERMFLIFQTGLLELPNLILLSTDGYRKSFSKESDFLKVATDINLMIQNHGVEQVKSSLNAWLNETSKQGSGDDITLGLIVKREP